MMKVSSTAVLGRDQLGDDSGSDQSWVVLDCHRYCEDSTKAVEAVEKDDDTAAVAVDTESCRLNRWASSVESAAAAGGLYQDRGR